MKINTVNGQIDSSELGGVLMHEHVANIYTEMMVNYPDWLNKDDIAKKFAEFMEEIKPNGIKSICDATPVNLGRDAELLKKAADASGANIMVTAGFYHYEYPWVGSSEACCEPERMASYMIRDFEHGIQGTDIKPAQVKCATDTLYGYTKTNEHMIMAAGIASKATGLPVITHTNSKDGKCGLYQQDILIDECGIAPHRIYIGHAFDGADPDYIEKLCKRGTYVGCDRLAYDIICPLEKVAAALAEVCKRGYADHVFLSHDASALTDYSFSFSQIRLSPRNPQISGYATVFNRFIPMIKELGVTDEQIKLMLFDNPQRFYSGTPFAK